MGKEQADSMCFPREHSWCFKCNLVPSKEALKVPPKIVAVPPKRALDITKCLWWEKNKQEELEVLPKRTCVCAGLGRRVAECPIPLSLRHKSQSVRSISRNVAPVGTMFGGLDGVSKRHYHVIDHLSSRD